jgi:hypothetical protein
MECTKFFYGGVTEAFVADKGTLLSCYVGFIPHKMDRDELLAAISGSIELTLVSDAVRSLVRPENYNIAGRNLKLSFTSNIRTARYGAFGSGVSANNGRSQHA